MKSKKKHETHDTMNQRPWFCSSLERLSGLDADAPMFRTMHGDGSIVVRSRAKVLEMVRRLAASLREMGVARGHIVLVDTALCNEALMVWCACMWLGAAAEFLPVDMRQRDRFNALAQARSAQNAPVAVLVQSPKQAKAYHEHDAEAPVIYIDAEADGVAADQILGWPLPENIMRFELAAEPRNIDIPQQIVLDDDETAAFVYSQGTHGEARRAAISHAMLRDQAEDLADCWKIETGDCLFMRLSSVQTVALVVFATALFSGAAMALDAGQNVADAYLALGATHVFLIPRDLAKLRADILSPRAPSASGQKWRNISLALAKFRTRNVKPYLKWTSPLIDKLCLVPIKKAYFSTVRVVISFGSNFDSKVGELFGFLNVPVYNAYTSCEVGFVHIHAFMGTGGFLKSVEPRIRSGILSIKPRRGNTPFVSTNDFVFEDDRCGLCVRRDSAVTLADGDVIFTTPMHDILCRNDIIDEILIFGESRPFLTALVYLNRDAAERWANAHRIDAGTFDQIAKNPQVYQHVLGFVESCNKMRAIKESIHKIAILPKPIEDDPYILSPCYLTRPAEAERRYSAIIESFYIDNF